MSTALIFLSLPVQSFTLSPPKSLAFSASTAVKDIPGEFDERPGTL